MDAIQPSEEIQRYQLMQRRNGGADWFFWIAGLSVLNSILIQSGVEISFIFGLGASVFVDVVGSSLGTAGKVVALLLNVCIAMFVVAFGVMGRKGFGWAILVGMGLYALDGLLYLALGDFLAAGFHAFALFGIWGGYSAQRELNALHPAILQSAAPLPAPEGPTPPVAPPATQD